MLRYDSLTIKTNVEILARRKKSKLYLIVAGAAVSVKLNWCLCQIKLLYAHDRNQILYFKQNERIRIHSS